MINKLRQHVFLRCFKSLKYDENTFRSPTRLNSFLRQLNLICLS